MKTTFDNIFIEAIASALPSTVQDLNSEWLGISEDEIARVASVTGITKVAVAPNSTTASDLCVEAARTVLSPRPDYLQLIDAVIFVSQSRDYILPSTASVIQSKLGLSSSCLCLDIPSGCTGYLHGLYLASSFIASRACRKVLVLCGETNSKLISQKDRTVSMIFGDGGSATVLGNLDGANSFYNFRTDGSGYDKIIIHDGGSRSPCHIESLAYSGDSKGNSWRGIDMRMDGMSVFNFAITEVPQLVKESLEECGLASSDIDLFAAHQANRLIVNQLAKKCGFLASQSPFLAGAYGNTGPASIPLLLSHGFAGSTSRLTKVLMCGFGVGLNWGVSVCDLSKTTVYPVQIID